MHTVGMILQQGSLNGIFFHVFRAMPQGPTEPVVTYNDVGTTEVAKVSEQTVSDQRSDDLATD
jgi:hypothetical protein